MRCTCPNKPAGVPCCLTAKGTGTSRRVFLGVPMHMPRLEDKLYLKVTELLSAMEPTTITEADEAEVSTTTDYGAIVYPAGINTRSISEEVSSEFQYRVTSLSQDRWVAECRNIRGGEYGRINFHSDRFVNPQSAYAWLEETGRV